MTIEDHINQQQPERQAIMRSIHDVILKNDPHVEPSIGTMMGKEMIIYNQRGFFKYALASVKDHLSLHLMTIYAVSPLHTKYQQLLPNAHFQKGCINFKTAAELPLGIVAQLIADSSKIDLLAMREEYLASKKKRK